MPTTALTAAQALPYPLNTDRVQDGALRIEQLAEAVDARLTAEQAARAAGDVAGAAAIPKALVDAKGDILTATANDVPARLGVGADGAQLTADSTQPTGLRWVAPVVVTSPPGTILARQQYAPGTAVAYTVAGALAALDTTNLAVTFTVPASGAVILRAVVFAYLGSSSAGVQAVMRIGWKNHAGGAVFGVLSTALITSVVSNAGCPVVVEQLVTGLVAGTVYTLDLAATTGGSPHASFHHISAGGTTAVADNTGPAVLEAIAA